TSAPRHPSIRGPRGVVELVPPRRRGALSACYLDQSAMLYISESHGVGSTPLRLFAAPEVAKVRFTSGMITTSWIRVSFALIASSLRFAWSVSVRSEAMIASKSLLEYRL